MHHGISQTATDIHITNRAIESDTHASNAQCEQLVTGSMVWDCRVRGFILQLCIKDTEKTVYLSNA